MQEVWNCVGKTISKQSHQVHAVSEACTCRCLMQTAWLFFGCKEPIVQRENPVLNTESLDLEWLENFRLNSQPELDYSCTVEGQAQALVGFPSMSLGCCLSDLLQKTICLQGCQRCLDFIQKGFFFDTFRLSQRMHCLKGFDFHGGSIGAYPIKFSQWRRFWGRITFHLSTLQSQKDTFTWQGANVNSWRTFHIIPYHPMTDETNTPTVWKMDKTCSAQTGPPRYHTCYCDLCHITIVPGELHVWCWWPHWEFPNRPPKKLTLRSLWINWYKLGSASTYKQPLVYHITNYIDHCISMYKYIHI